MAPTDETSGRARLTATTTTVYPRICVAAYRSRGLEIVGVSFEDIPGDARTFVAQEHADWTFARDDDGTIAGAYGVRPIPETFFVRRDGTLAGRLLEIPSARQLDASLQGILGT